jgi:hypothetical protein
MRYYLRWKGTLVHHNFPYNLSHNDIKYVSLSIIKVALL